MGEDEGLPRAALVTGAAKRVGRALALALAADGYDLALHCNRSREEAEDLAREVGAAGERRAVVVAADLAREGEVEPLVAAAVRGLGRPLGVLVNNASHFGLDRLATADRGSWDAHLETNLRAPVVLTRAFVAQLPDGAPGAVVNLLDQRVLNLTPNYLSYSVSRLGLWAATQVLARELAPRGVRVNAIGPGPTLAAPGMAEERFRELVDGLPLRRGPTPGELAEALRFILRMPAMTGQLVTLDGGQQMGWLTPKAPDIE